MIILLHSSKTMREPTDQIKDLRAPALIDKAVKLHSHVSTFSGSQLATLMHTSDKVGAQTQGMHVKWNPKSAYQLPVLDIFRGDIYSGLQVHTFSSADRAYADSVLYILSGLYGVLKPLDTVQPYRLEMAYKLAPKPYKNMYDYWGDSLAATLPTHQVIVNVSSDEYTKAVLPYVGTRRIITPKFLTISPKSGQPTFVVVHAKVARGAFAHWMIINRVQDPDELKKFNELNYSYSSELSTVDQPVFICNEFGGIGLSVRLQP